MASKLCESIKKRLHDRAERNVRRVASESLRRLVGRTPIRTGCAQANWRVSLNHPDLTFDKTANFTNTPRRSVIHRGKEVISLLELGDSIHISNSTPYIRNLEYGWSQQAPNGFVRITAAEMRILLQEKRGLASIQTSEDQ